MIFGGKNIFQLLILANVLLQSVVNTNKGPVLIPIVKLTEKERKKHICAVYNSSGDFNWNGFQN